jgi:class 3 adenylate cyclase
MLHNWDKKGLAAVQADLVERYDEKDRYPGATPDFLRVLRGRIAYLAMIRGSSDLRARVFLDQYENLRAGRSINEGIDYLPQQPHRAAEPIERRRVVTVMFTDLVDSTARSLQLGDDEWHRRVEAHFRRAESQVRRHGGSPIKTIGDANLATFPNPSTAIHCALAIVASERLSDLGVRIGLHTGEVGHVEARQDIDGIGVALAARVEAAAGLYEVLASETVKDLVIGGPYAFEYRGLYELKGIGEKRLYAVTDVDVTAAGSPRWRVLSRFIRSRVRRTVGH